MKRRRRTKRDPTMCRRHRRARRRQSPPPKRPTDRSRDMLTTRKRANATRSAQDPNPMLLRDSLRITDRTRLTARPHRPPHNPRATNTRIATVSRRPIIITAANTATAELLRTERTGTSSPQQPPRPPKKPKEKKKFGIGAVCALLVAAIILSTGLGIGGSYMLFGRNGTAGGSQTSSGGNTVIYESTEPKVDTSSVAGSTDTAKVVAAVEESVVEITTETVTTSTFFGQYVTQGAGSGVVVSSDGYIVTNNHVVDGATNIKVTLANKTTYDATVVGTDEKTDIAVVKINATGLTPAVFGDSSQIVVGQDVIVIGNPLGSLGGSVTKGIVSALDRQVTIENQTMTLLQIDAAVNPGNSGGGAFDANGNLIGIVNAKSTGSNIDNLGFAIPVNTAKTVINDIIQYGDVTAAGSRRVLNPSTSPTAQPR